MDPIKEERLPAEEIYLQLLEAQKAARMWKERCTQITREKAAQLKNIETNLMFLESKLIQERRKIEEQISRQDRMITQQKNKIAKLNSTNQKLLAGMMVMRYQKKPNFSGTNSSIKEEKPEKEINGTKATGALEETAKTYHIRGSDLIACRARSVAKRIEMEKLQRSSSDINRDDVDQIAQKSRKFRSQSLPHARIFVSTKRLAELKSIAETHDMRTRSNSFDMAKKSKVSNPFEKRRGSYQPSATSELLREHARNSKPVSQVYPQESRKGCIGQTSDVNASKEFAHVTGNIFSRSMDETCRDRSQSFTQVRPRKNMKALADRLRLKNFSQSYDGTTRVQPQAEENYSIEAIKGGSIDPETVRTLAKLRRNRQRRSISLCQSSEFQRSQQHAATRRRSSMTPLDENVENLQFNCAESRGSEKVDEDRSYEENGARARKNRSNSLPHVSYCVRF